MATNPPLVALIRLAGYTLCMAASLALTGQLIATDHKLSKALAGLLLGWALNALILASLLLFQCIAGNDDPAWRQAALTVNALIIGVAPILLWYALNRWEKGK